ncbi:MAG: 2-succinyl-5-enolpyruvyl-6-hydroxy-3-cyclohexene-1-carboxylic-acid synthase [Ktedonobacterales bacterium]
MTTPEQRGETHPHIEPANPLYAYIGAFVDELWRAGVRQVVVCPGSRSTPLALTLVNVHPGLRVWMHVDERSAAFFALGMAKGGLGEPVALVCTSGTAAANFYPALVEANLSHIPLLALTADRPHELRDTGAPQAIDQNRLYGAHVKWFADAALPEASNVALRYIRALADRAVGTALAVPIGPVHLNFPLREPLIPAPQPLPPIEQRDAESWYGRPDGAPYTIVTSGKPTLTTAQIERLAETLTTPQRGLILAGPQPDSGLSEPLLRLARRLGYPVLADPLSQLRRPASGDNTPVITSYDAFLRSERFASTSAPEVVLRFGPMLTSKPALLYLQRYSQCRQIVVDGQAGWEEPTHLASEMIAADPVDVCERLLAALGERESGTERDWAQAWWQTDQVTHAALTDAITRLDQPFEGRVFTELARALPAGATLVVGNSMPVRDCDTFFWGGEQAIRVLGNRGANGIDGVISTALGVSAAQRAAGDEGPVVLVIGDLSFYHDLNGLLAAKLHGLDLTVILVNNDGGGIFSFLAQADYPQHFEQVFGTPLGLDFSSAVAMYGGAFTRLEGDWASFRAALAQSLSAGGLQVIEVATERASNVQIHRELWQVVEAALADTGIIPFRREQETAR